MIYIFIFYSGLINWIRGGNLDNFFFSESEIAGGKKIPLRNKLTTSFLLGSGFFLLNYATLGLSTQTLIQSVIVFLGVYLWSTEGWGKYFTAYNGKVDTYLNERESFIDDITDWIFKLFLGKNLGEWLGDRKIKGEHNIIRAWGTLAMSLRGLIFGYPLFIAMSYFELWALIYGLGLLLQGPCYALMRWIPIGKHKNALAEFLVGIVWGILIALMV